jgi:enoyl-[acyl-carrier protein] reductase III
MTNGLLQGKKVLITGSSRGIGRSCALAMARQGADIAIHYRRERELADQTADEVRALGREALVFEADLENAEQIDRMFDRLASAWGCLDVFMANAAATAFKPLADLRTYHFERTFHVVVQSVLQSVQRCLALMEGREGRIITVSSPGSHITLPRYASIGTSKAALEALTRYIAAEFGPRGITANAISPGVVQTDSATYYAQDKYEEWRQSVIDHTPLQRLVMPEDVADVAVFLASDWSRFVTGQVLIVDGGLELTGGGFEMV